jgi:hypothetical protein
MGNLIASVWFDRTLALIAALWVMVCVLVTIGAVIEVIYLWASEQGGGKSDGA